MVIHLTISHTQQNWKTVDICQLSVSALENGKFIRIHLQKSQNDLKIFGIGYIREVRYTFLYYKCKYYKIFLKHFILGSYCPILS